MRKELSKIDVSTLVAKNIKIIGVNVKARRKKMKYTQFDLAVYADCSISLISELETGVSSGMTLCTLVKISEALEIDIDALFCE